MSKSYVFDSYALLALLEDEKGADLIAGILTKQENQVYLSIINMGEIYYLLLRRKGMEQAEKVIESVALDDAIVVAEASWDRVRAAALVKAEGGLSYADAFAVSLAKELNAPLLTGDPEIITKAENYGIQVLVV
jgi:PIN domain nuclease of toxin-antitoxin system